jgi:hypothetical protein
MQSTVDLELSIGGSLQESQFSEIVADFQADGIRAGVTHRKPEGPYMAFELLIPTLVILWIAKPYFNEFFKETGKLHANALHNGLSKLWNKVFGPKPEVTYSIVDSKGKVRPSDFSSAVSVKAQRKDGGEVTLLFPANTSREDFSKGVDKFLELLNQHHSAQGPDTLTDAMQSVDYLDSPGWQVLTYFNPAGGELELIDYIASSRTGKLTTQGLPTELL